MTDRTLTDAARTEATMTAEQRLDAVLAEVRIECLKAIRKFKPFNSPHEGYAVIAEELDELWDEVKGNQGRELSALEEAVQVAAMGVRYVVDMGNAHD